MCRASPPQPAASATKEPAMHQRPARKSEPSAAEVYAARRSDIARLLDVLDMELTRHAEKAAADPRSWALTGDLGHVRSGLVEMVAFISGMETAEVEAFLADND